MNWKTLFTAGTDILPDDARKLMSSKKPQDIQLLDVRQPKEYERGHIAGSILIPLKELPERIAEIDKEKTTLVYCHSGMRSKAATQILKGLGFKDVHNIKGGIRAWNGLKSIGSEVQGMEFFTSADFKNAFQMAYSMEQGLKELYMGLAETISSMDQKELLLHMAQFEDGHMAKLQSMYNEEVPQEGEENPALEGGFNQKEVMANYNGQIGNMTDIIELGMMLETQALDLYSRLARKSENPKIAGFYRQMAKEEQGHLNQLTRELDKILAGYNPWQDQS
ncbi:MAG: rhodanese-like domain-containing protein [Desulfurivibrionaceae bacterium]